MLALTDSFQAEWAGLASANGLGLVLLDASVPATGGSHAVTIVSAAGVEDRLAGAIAVAREGSRTPAHLAAVGSLADHRLASAVVRSGADEYFALPQDFRGLSAWVRECAGRLESRAAASAFSADERRRYRFEGITGDSPALHAALERAARVIPRAGVTILITGETGTGKELLARAIHYNGPRQDAPFVDVNCAAIPENLLESELFGHEKGAFTGAMSAKPGLMELANGGTLFLDEIGHLAMPLQGKMLRALEERTVRRVGGQRNIPFDVRLVAATHVDLAAAVRRGEFREDLYYRLNVVPIELPPLRARGADIIALARTFIQRFASEYGLEAPTLTAAAIQSLRDRRWSGNVRELRNAMERAVLLATAPLIDAGDLAEPAVALSSSSDLPFPATLATLERAAAERMVELCGGNKTEAARRLDISRPRLARLLSVAGAPDDQDGNGMER